MRFVLATLNRDKLRELKDLLSLPELELVALADAPGGTAPAETGETLAENALLKARAAMKLTDLPAIADDTGLEVDALDGRPGVRAARYAGPNASYADNVRRLLDELSTVEPERRGARFHTVCVACWPDGIEFTADGMLEGRIAPAPRGTNGFGYDAVFEIEGAGRTLGEMSAAEKNALSHRARAARRLAELIRIRLEG